MLTAARTGEVRGATWGEIDRDERTWTISAERMKARREHCVPLSGRALNILQEAQVLSDGAPESLLFPAKRGGTKASKMVFEMLLRRLEVSCVPHRFRASFRGYLARETGASWAIAEPRWPILRNGNDESDGRNSVATRVSHRCPCQRRGQRPPQRPRQR